MRLSFMIVQPMLGVASAGEAVGRVGEPVLVQRPGDGGRNGDREGRDGERGQGGRRQDRRDDGGGEREDRPGERHGIGRAREIRRGGGVVVGGKPRHRQAREEAQGGGEVGEDPGGVEAVRHAHPRGL